MNDDETILRSLEGLTIIGVEAVSGAFVLKLSDGRRKRDAPTGLETDGIMLLDVDAEEARRAAREAAREGSSADESAPMTGFTDADQ